MFDSIAHRRKWRRANPELAKARARKEKYGISDKEFRTLFKKQKGKCYICRKRETLINWRTGKVRELCVDHNHKTKRFRKLLCWRCNLGIGIFRENWRLLQAASKYLKTNKGIR